MQYKYNSILDTHPELICRFSAEFTLTYVNRMFAEFFQGQEADFIGKSLFEVVQEKQRSSLEEKLSALTPEAPAPS